MNLHHHGDAETGPGLLDFAVNVYAGPRPTWLEAALIDGIAASSAYPDVAPARAALAARHGRAPGEVLPTAGAAEAFTLVARLRARRTSPRAAPGSSPPGASTSKRACGTAACRSRRPRRPSCWPRSAGVHAALRQQGMAVRRGGTFPGLDDSWVRIAARPPDQAGRLLVALDTVRAGLHA